MANIKTQGKENRKPGRPKNWIIVDGDEPINVHTAIPKKYWQRVPKNSRVTWSELLLIGIEVKFPLNPDEKVIRELKEKINYHDTELARAKITLDEINRKLALDEEIRKTLRIEEKYPAFAFRNFISSQIKRKKGLPPITMNDEFIREKWGISFDREKLNHDITENDFRVDFEENLITNEEMVEKYSIKKVSSQAELAHEINQEIEKEIGLS